MKKTVAIVFVFIFLGLLAMSLGMSYHYIDSIGDEALWKDILSFVFTLFFIAYWIYSFAKNDEAALKGFLIYCLICLIGSTPFPHFFVYTGLGLFQPAFFLLFRLSAEPASNTLVLFITLGPYIIIFSGFVFSALGRATIKMNKSKADSAEKHTENNNDTGE